jgi:hypothetical protein
MTVFKIGDIVRNKQSGNVGTVERTNLGPGMAGLILVRFHDKNGNPQGDGLCQKPSQLEKVEVQR